MFGVDLLLLALSAVIFADPSVECIFVDAQVARGLGNGLVRLDREFDCALLEFSRIFFCRGLAHRTHLVCCVMSVSPCARQSIATSDSLAYARIYTHRPIVRRGKGRERPREAACTSPADG